MQAEIKLLVDAYRQYATEIRDLSSRALVSNFGYDADRVLSLINSHDDAHFSHVKALLIFDDNKLMAVIPYKKARIDFLMPFKILENWVDKYNFIGDPLIDLENINSVLKTFSQWQSDHKSYVIFNDITNNQLRTSLNENAQSDKVQPFQTLTRAAIETDQPAQDYYANAINSGKRRRLKKFEKKLQVNGKMEFKILNGLHDTIPSETIKSWSKTFLEIESSGWKGNNGTALASMPQSGEYFQSCTDMWFAEKKIIAVELRLDGYVIASLYIALEKTEGKIIARCQKTAYREEYGYASPGVIILYNTLQYLLDQKCITFIDSCTSPDNLVANSLMKQHTNMEYFVAVPPNRMLIAFSKYVNMVEVAHICSRRNAKLALIKFANLKSSIINRLSQPTIEAIAK